MFDNSLHVFNIILCVTKYVSYKFVHFEWIKICMGKKTFPQYDSNGLKHWSIWEEIETG